MAKRRRQKRVSRQRKVSRRRRPVKTRKARGSKKKRVKRKAIRQRGGGVRSANVVSDIMSSFIGI